MFGFKSLFGSDFDHSLESRINPANGLPMIEGSDFDIAGNFYGTDYTSGGFDCPSSSSFDMFSGCSIDD